MLDDKDLEKDWGKNDKKMDVESGPVEEKEKELFEKFWIVKTRGNSWKKKLSKQILIDRKTDLIDRKLHSIDQVSIEHRSSQADSNQNFNHNFDRLKIWKNQIFEN